MKHFLVACLALASISALAGPYKVVMEANGIPDGTKAYIINYDTNEKIDSAYVDKARAVFTGDIDEPVPALIFTTRNQGEFVLEEGSCVFNGEASGSMLNDILSDEHAKLMPKFNILNQSKSQEEYDKNLADVVIALTDAVKRNADTPVGYIIFRMVEPAMQGEALISLVDSLPALRKYDRVAISYALANSRLLTSVGKPYKDFTVTYEGVSKSLSDYVGKGQYVLVDFWASWCGPCMREMPVLKEIYNEFAPKGLKMLGVAVWDKPADTEAAIERLQLPWEVIIDAQAVPTDIYGITGIPSLIVFGPDGTIISRDLRGQELKNFIANLYNK